MTERPAPAARRERLQKLLANAGEGSRRALEQRIDAGDVRVNGEVAKLGATATKGDEIAIGGAVYRVVDKPAFHRSIVYNKLLVCWPAAAGLLLLACYAKQK